MPNSYHELTSGSDIPDSYLAKIAEFQKKGGINNYQGILTNLGGLREQCGLMLKEAEAVLMEEEGFDNHMRSQFGARWTAVPSTTMNGPYKQNLGMYAQKLEQAAKQDGSSAERFNSQKGELDILGKTK